LIIVSVVLELAVPPTKVALYIKDPSGDGPWIKETPLELTATKFK
jgi:hypothetical protein